MKVTIIELNKNQHSDLLAHVCNHLFIQWKKHYMNLFGIYSPKELVKFYHDTPPLIMYVALTHDGKFVGCYSMTKKGSLYWLTDMFVVPEFRNQGMGRMLVDHAIKDCNNVALHAQADVVPFYEKQGFQLGLKYERKGSHGGTFEYYNMLYNKTYDIALPLICVLITIGMGLFGIVVLL